MRREQVEYEADGLTFRSELFVGAGTGRRQAVLVFPEAFGLGDHDLARAERLAARSQASGSGIGMLVRFGFDGRRPRTPRRHLAGLVRPHCRKGGGIGVCGMAKRRYCSMRAAARISSREGIFAIPAGPSIAHSICAQRTMPSRSIRNWPLSCGH